jgi:hypothetical protein
MRIAAMVVAAVGLVIVAGALWAGGQVGGIRPVPHVAPNVIGMPLAQAQRALRRGGDVTIVVRRVGWAPAGKVAGIQGVGFDGSYTRDSVIRLSVGR